MSEPETLETLLEQYLAGTLAGDALEKLDARLRAEPRAAAQLVQFAAIDELLETFHREDQTISQAAALLVSLGLETPLQAQAKDELAQPELAPSEPLSRGGQTLPAAIDWRHHPLRFWATAATLTVAMWAVLMLAWSPTEEPRQVAPSSTGHAPQLVARLLRSVGAVWSDRGAGFDGAHLHAGQTLILEAGLAEVHFRGGAQVILEGPCEFRAMTEGAGELTQGRLTAQVPPAAVGFVVQTPLLRLRDLGTEFGAEVLPDTTGEVAVFTGRVEVQWTPDEDGATPQVEQMNAGEALWVSDAGRRVERRALPRGKFVRTLPRLEPRQVAIANSSFEQPLISAQQEWLPTVQDWTIASNGGAGVSQFGGEFFAGTPDGAQMAFLNQGSITQQLSETLAPHTAYRLTMLVGNRPGTLAPGYVIELRAGESVLAVNSNGALPADGFFAEAVVRFTTGETHAALGQPLVISIRSTGGLETQTQNHFDRVQLEATPLRPPSER